MDRPTRRLTVGLSPAQRQPASLADIVPPAYRQPVVEGIPVEDAHDLLDLISHRNDRWSPSTLWRGQADENWRLLPSIHRPASTTHLLKTLRQVHDPNPTWMEVITLEAELLGSFISLANTNGLYLPADVVQGYLDAEDENAWAGPLKVEWLPKTLERTGGARAAQWTSNEAPRLEPRA